VEAGLETRIATADQTTNKTTNKTTGKKTQLLRSLMQQADIPSFRALSQAAEVSEWQIEQLRQGKAAQMRVEVLYQISRALKVSLVDLIHTFAALPEPETSLIAKGPKATFSPQSHSSETAGVPTISTKPAVSVEELQQEYDRLQIQMAQQQEELQRSFQQTTLQLLETWLVQFPTLVYAAQQNPQFPAKNFLVFMRPIERLLNAWGIEAIAPVGAELPYDPQYHQLMDGTAQPGDLVRVRYTGYRQGKSLLYRAQVSRKPPS
jgi:DNA-binding Xre family transcriptional regulator/molecular chaperone GrpE (heat shock protein)